MMFLTVADPTVTSLTTDLGTIVTSAFGWITQIAKMVTTTPILLFTVGFLALGGAIGLFGRMLSRG